MSDTQQFAPSLYPVRLRLWCPMHGPLDDFTVTSLRAQQQWTETFTGVHERAGCPEPLSTTVVTQ